MTHSPSGDREPIEDETVSAETRRDESAQVRESELLELLQPRRSDPDAFDASVRQRIAARRRRFAGHSSSPWQQVAASAAPLANLTPGKGLGWMLSLPAILLAGSGYAFVSGLRRVRRGAAGSAEDLPAATGGWLAFVLQLGPVVVMAAPWLFGAAPTMDVIMLLLVVAMIAFSRQASTGEVAPAEVARMGTGLLTTMALIACYSWSLALGQLAADSDLGLGTSAVVVFLGIAILSVLAGVFDGWSGRSKAGVVAAAVTAVVGLGFFAVTGSTRTDPEDLVEAVAQFHANPETLGGWAEVAAAVETLESCDAIRPDLARVRDAVATAVADPSLEVHPVVWTAAARMGVVTDTQWRTLAAREDKDWMLQQLMRGDGALHMVHYDEYQLWMLMGARSPSSDSVARLSARVDASWAVPTDGRALHRASLCVRLLDVLGRGDLVESKRAEIHEVLRRHWVSKSPQRFARVGGFTPDPAEFPTSFDDETWLAIGLMARVGVPTGIDLRKVRAYLRHESRQSWFVDTRQIKLLSRAALLRLERAIGLPAPSPGEVLLGERVLIATSLLVLLCVLSVFAAARAGTRVVPSSH